jgi:hypothetical protein
LKKLKGLIYIFFWGPLGPVGPVTLKPFTRAYVKVYNITGPTGPHVLMFYIFYCVNFIAITLIYSPSAQSYASYLLADSLKSSSGQYEMQQKQHLESKTK